MSEAQARTVGCQVCKQTKGLNEVMAASMIRQSIIDEIRKEQPDWSPDGFVCLQDLDRLRTASNRRRPDPTHATTRR